MNGSDGSHDRNFRREQVLARGLAAFDESARRRRTRRVAARVALATLLLAAGGLVVVRTVRPAASGLPAYVEILVDDRQLTAELELANACERIGRVEGRLVVVECAVPRSTGPSSPGSLPARDPAS